MQMRTGKCLCGAIRFRAEIGTDVQACHCTECQRWTGGGPLYSVAAQKLEIDGEESISAYHASEWGERGFCGTCGSPLYWRMQGRDISGVTPGLLDDQSGLRVTEEIFVDYRPDWVAPVPGAIQSTEAQEIAKFKAAYGEGAT